MLNSTRVPAVALVAAAVAIALAYPARAEFDPAVKWLMNQPASLWDRGMDRMIAGVDRAADDLRDTYSREFIARLGGKDGGTIPFSASRTWDWENNEILISIGVLRFPHAALRPPIPSDHKICNTARQFFLSVLANQAWHFWGRPPPSSKELVTAMHDTITHWFSHVGYRSKSRNKDLEVDLARFVFVEATIFAKTLEDRHRNITCKARITKWDAPSEPQ